MSRIGKQPILIPDNVEVVVNNQEILIKGPKGELSYRLPREILAVKEEDQLSLKVANSLNKKTKALWGLWRSLLNNAVLGVSQGFQKELEIRGIGYGAELKGNNLILNLGFSHPVEVEVPQDLSVKVEKTNIIIGGIDKQKVGQFASQIRAYRKPDPYKGKGIRYKGEKVRQKEGKKAVGTGA